MIRPLVHDTIFLKIRAKDADAEDVQTAKDLAETLEHHKEGCVGMAANMIGVPKIIIVFYDSKKIITMFNPEITGNNQPYETEEGCLSLLGGPRSVTRYKSIKVRYQDKFMKTHEKRFSGFTAQIIQHEVDHCNGVLI
ncbi:peptide deformylase [Ruminococcus flavefaciens]|uniref:peptide deformylase n=1 Tax=Ruminococcus flavefaciens TaxID=1265 RepID=UPI0015648581|nr:peptide deformylase [Ruminococcus flavefaciens]